MKLITNAKWRKSLITMSFIKLSNTYAYKIAISQLIIQAKLLSTRTTLMKVTDIVAIRISKDVSFLMNKGIVLHDIITCLIICKLHSNLCELVWEDIRNLKRSGKLYIHYTTLHHAKLYN